ncbi:MAG TPA: thiamine pyrophosphate-dependent enzyme, partial [Synergistaceae bacterium]|nr:thiamine pyrophosphate-dependent enzyme [Synergistaceae bacterium]
VATTLMGKGAFPENHPLSLGMVGMHGTPQANLAVSEAEVILALGTRFSDRSTGGKKFYAPKATIIHVDLDEAELGKNIPASFPILGNTQKVLSKMLEKLPVQKDRSPWIDTIAAWRRNYPLREKNPPGALSVPGILGEIRKRHEEEGILTTDVGQHQMWAALHYEVNRSRTYLTSGGLGTMGFGLPAAIGAAFAHPGERVVCVAGDGGFLMNIQELETCRRYNLPITIVLCNNGSLGMVRQWQDLFFQQRFSGTCENPTCSFIEVARAFGLEAHSASNQEELERALDQGFASSGPSLVECFVPPEDNVYPMVPAGGNLKEFLFYPS